MKHIILFLIGIIIASCCHAQKFCIADKTIYSLYDQITEDKIPIYATNFKYNSDLTLKEEFSAYYVQSNGASINSIMASYTYNKQKKLESKLLYIWDANSNSWQMQELSTYTYHVANNKTTKLIQTWDKNLQSLINHSLIDTIFNVQNKAIEIIKKDWNQLTNSWTNNNSEILNYTNNNLLKERVTSWWDSSLNQYIPSNKYDYQYNAQESLIEEVISDWDIRLNKYAPKQKKSFSYNTDNNINDITTDTYKNATWTKATKEIYFYNAKNLLEEIVTLNWNDFLNQYDNYTKFLYFYNRKNEAHLMRLLIYDKTKQLYIPYQETEYFCPIINSNNDNITDHSIKIFPNPTDGLITIETDQIIEAISIKNQIGQQVIYPPVFNNTIDCASLNPGIYIIDVKVDNKIFYKKIIIK